MENTGIGGSSLGGLVSLFLGLRMPEIFGKIAALSPSVWWNQRVILRFADAAPVDPRPRVWLDIGTREGPRIVEDVERFRDVLLRKGWRWGQDLHYERVLGAEHNEAAWAARVGPSCNFSFLLTEAGCNSRSFAPQPGTGLGMTSLGIANVCEQAHHYPLCHLL